MGTSRTYLQNATIRHSIYVNRFAGSQQKIVLNSLKRIRDVTAGRLAQENLTFASKERLKATLAQIDMMSKDIFDEMNTKVVNDMKELAAYEAQFNTKMFTLATAAEFSKPTQATVNAAVFSKPIHLLDEAVTIEGALRQYSKVKRRQMLAVISDGVITGRTSDQIIGDLGVLTSRLERNHASALVRTVTNHVSTATRDVLIRDNEDVVDGYEWVSTLDDRTTSTCQALDEQVFKYGEGPMPPQHWGCRSTIIPHVRPEYSIKNELDSERPAIGADGVENVSGRIDYNTWLRQQPASFQDDILGEAKGKLFRAGGLPVGAFVDNNYAPLTLEQLKRTEPMAFEKAGLNDNL